ncbi:hypothetical protein AB0G04_18830 [Actinoplanes sp. NPDC023801]|uniref:hypothetical protein n=1 Tax=Actinoplanes sp. NPDC023801 TaxID=3154595 RepID=UPI0033EF25E5
MSIPPRLYVLGAGLLLTGIGLALTIDATSAYSVNIAESGDGCAKDGINIDSRTGLSLMCIGPDDGRDSPSPFTVAEKERVYALAQELGDDEDGLTDEDETLIEDLVDGIAAANGDPDESDDQAGSPGHIAFLTGAPLALGGGILVLSRGLRDPEF